MTVQTPATGVWFFPDQPAGRLVDAIVHAERAGIDQVWLGDEGPAREPFSVLAAAAMVTTRIRLAVGVTNPYVRQPGVALATAASIAELSDGRLILGVGAGGVMSLEPFGLAVEAPVAAVRRFLDIVRAGRRGSSVDGYRHSDIAVAASAPDVPVYVGARSPQLNKLASELADGAFVAGLPPFRYGEVIGWARSVRPIDISICASVAFDDVGRERHRPEMIWSLLDTPPAVRDRLGLDLASVEAAAMALRSGDPGPASRLVTDELLGHLMLLGDPTTIGAALAQLVREHRPAGIGLAMVHSDLESGIDDCASAFAEMRRLLAADASGEPAGTAVGEGLWPA